MTFSDAFTYIFALCCSITIMVFASLIVAAPKNPFELRLASTLLSMSILSFITSIFLGIRTFQKDESLVLGSHASSHCLLKLGINVVSIAVIVLSTLILINERDASINGKYSAMYTFAAVVVFGASVSFLATSYAICKWISRKYEA